MIYRNKIIHAEVLKGLSMLPDKSVHMVVTSIPYYAARDYGTATWIGGDPKCKHQKLSEKVIDKSRTTSTIGYYENNGNSLTNTFKGKCRKCGAIRVDEQLGLEEEVDCGAWTRVGWKFHKEMMQLPGGELTMVEARIPADGITLCGKCYICKMLAVFRQAHRVLRDDGTVWLNIGDSYWGGKGRSGSQSPEQAEQRDKSGASMNHKQQQLGGKGYMRPTDGKHDTIKPKDMVGVPWTLALALRADGWYLRQDIIWHKSNPMPESINDRCTKAHEYIFLLAKQRKYFFDSVAIKKEWEENEYDIKRSIDGQPEYKGKHQSGYFNTGIAKKRANLKATGGVIGSAIAGANKRSVWKVPASSFAEAHFATFPEDLIIDCIKAGTSEFGVCAECGAPWVRLVNKKLVATNKAAKNIVDSKDHGADNNSQGHNRQKDGHKPGHVNNYVTLGCTRTCDCKTYKVVKSIVLDFFGGSGTTAVVASRLDRDWCLIDLNGEYVKMAERRIQSTVGLFKT